MNSTRKCLAMATLLVLFELTQSTTASPALAFLSNAGIPSPHTHTGGLTYSDWGTQSWRWVNAIHTPINPTLVPTGGDSGQGQSGPVMHSWAPVGSTSFRPTINTNNDLPCPHPDFDPDPGQSLEGFLTEGPPVLDVCMPGVPQSGVYDGH